MDDTTLPSRAESAPAHPDQRLPVWRSEQLLCGQRELLIQHGDSWYRLRHTNTGKLILTK